MTLDALYPFWDGVHEEIVGLLQWLPLDAWEYKPAAADMRSIRQIVLHMIDMERYWIVHLAQNGPWEHPALADFRTQELQIEGLIAVRNQTRFYIETLNPESLTAVRTVPLDVETNSTTTNRTLAWLIWQALQHDIYHWGQIQMRRYEALSTE
jgi:uncharacterized damage-inducible protein DinB